MITERTDDGDWSPARLGSTIRAARARLGISVSELGRRSGLSQSFLSAVEAGQSDISIGRLLRVAQALGTRLPDLLEDAAQPGLNIVRSHERASVPVPQKGLKVSLLAPSIDSSRTFTFCTLAAGAVVEKSLLLRGGEYFLYLLEGEARLELTSGEAALLAPGDSVSYPSDDFGRMATVGRRACRFLWVYSNVNTKERP